MNSFEQRWNDQKQSFDYFNPITGEFVVEAAGYLDRSRSLWTKPEPVCDYAFTTPLLPEYYASRMKANYLVDLIIALYAIILPSCIFYWTVRATRSEEVLEANVSRER